MKILQVINSMGSGGAEKLLLESLPIFKQKGIDVDVLLLDGKETPFLKALRKGFTGKMHVLSSTNSVYNPINIARLRPFLKKYELVHVHLFPAQYFVPIAAKSIARKPRLVFTEHSTSNKRLENAFFKKIDRHIYKFYDKVIAITSEVQKIVCDHTNKLKSDVPVIENGVNLKGIELAKPLPRQAIDQTIQEDDVLIMQVSGFRIGKDQATLVKAITYLPENYKLLLAGDGATRGNIEALVTSLKLNTRVFFLGVRMDVPQLLKTTDINVLSSEWEGLSLSSIEGMASGKPFIASDVPGLKEVVGGAGVLFPLGDEKQLAQEILKLMEDKDYYQQIAKQCQERAQQYDIDKMVHAHIQLYQSLLAS